MFKYYSIPNLEIAKKIVGINPTIKFSPAYELNDPFELKFNLNINPESPIHKQLYFKNSPNNTEEDFKAWQNKITDNFVWYTEQELRKIFSQSYSITCFSQSNDNNLMWSHYAENHKGICVEYSEKIFDYFSSKNKFLASKKVSYSDEPPTLDIAEKKDSQVVKLFFNKQSEWKYEQEFRIINRGKNKAEFLPFDSKLIKSVLIGSKCDNKLEKGIIEICKSQNIKVYHGITMGKTYKIQFEEHKEDTIYMKSFW